MLQSAQTRQPSHRDGKRWAYPEELKNKLRNLDLTPEEVEEILNTSWEYTRCVIPDFTNWDRYMAITQLCVVSILAEYRGDLVDVSRMNRGDLVAGYDVHGLLDVLFGGTKARDLMGREYLSSIYFLATKTSGRQPDLMIRWIEAIASSPKTYFRLRDADGQFRLYVAAGIACNDLDDWPTEDEYLALGEMAFLMYDSVALYKHQAEGEFSNYYAYCGQDLEIRTKGYRTGRAGLWAADAEWSRKRYQRCATNVVRQFPMIHMSMRRYRFVEDGLTIGRPEAASDDVVAATRRNEKLWYRNEGATPGTQRVDTLDSVRHFLYPGLAEALSRPEADNCPQCTRRDVYGATTQRAQFGGVILCAGCRETYRAYVHDSWERWAKILPLER